MALEEFKEVLSDFRQLASLALKGAVAAPLADLWLRMGPSPTKPVAVLSSLMEFVAVIWVFQFWHDVKDRKLNTRMKTSLSLFCIGILASLTLLWSFTVLPGEGRDRVIEGVVLLPEIKPLITGSYTVEQALRESEYDAGKIWTESSIILVRIAITVIWMATFVFLAVYLTAFIILQRRHGRSRKVDEAINSAT